MKKQEYLVKDWMTPSVFTATADECIHNVAKLMRDKDIGCVVIVDPFDYPIGILSVHDIIHKVVAENLPSYQVTASEIMSAGITLASEDTTMANAAMILHGNGIKKLPIIDHERTLVGILTVTDMNKHLAQTGLPPLNF